MRIAVPKWGDKISPVFDTASRLLIVQAEGSEEESRFETYLDEQDLPRRCFRIQGLGVNVLICGAISHPFLRMLMASEIHIIQGISGNLEDVIEAYFEGTLYHTRFLMPGFKRNRFGQRNNTVTCNKRRSRQRQK